MTSEQLDSRSIFQLRIYEVSLDKRDAFHSRFENHAVRIMKRYGFEVIALWESSSVAEFEFIYLLKWPDTKTMDRQWQLFLADDEWIGIKELTARTTGEPVLRVTSRVLEEVDYSPAFNPA